MRFRKLRGAVLVGGAAIILAGLASPTEAGCLDWLFPCNQTAVTTYSAPFVAPAVASCNPCASPCASPCGAQTCAYTPVPSYRWTYSHVPYTSYRPVSTLDPCTGCARTSYQPVTSLSLLPWLHREPVTSYRAACYTPAPVVGACNPCSTPACGSCGVSPFAPASIAAPSSCSSCTSAAPVPGVAVPGITVQGASSPPSLDSAYPAQSTFLPGPSPSSNPAPGATPPLAPAGTIQATPDPIGSPSNASPPASSSDPASAQPGLLFPEGRTTVRPIQPVRPASGFRTVSFVAPAPVAEEPLDVDGWRAAK